jgi:competence protein ComFC
VTIALSHPRTWPVWDVFFPPVCAVCGERLESAAILFCDRCWINAPVADLRDFRKLRYVDRIASGYRFSGPDVVREAVHSLKYGGVKPLAAIMAQRLIPRLPIRFVEADLVWSEVPLHWRRHLSRGFNQSHELASRLAMATGHDQPVRLLRRIRHTPTQTARSVRERVANVKGAFTMRSGVPVPKRVLLIDDVITTGATMNECARTLKDAGVEWVGALSFALAQRS